MGSVPDPESQDIAAEYKMTLRKFLRYFELKDLLVLRSHYSVSGMERWFQELLGGHESFDELRTS